jgi:hypothetical protein
VETENVGNCTEEKWSDMTESELKNKILESIKAQGFKINPHVRPAENDKDVYRNIQQQAKYEQISLHKSFLMQRLPIIREHLIMGKI